MSIPVSVGQRLPLFVSLPERSSEHLVWARILSRHPYDILAEEVLLEPEYFEGDYTNFDITMPDLPFVDVIYTIFDVDGYTPLREEREVFVRRDGTGGQGSMEAEILSATTIEAHMQACS